MDVMRQAESSSSGYGLSTLETTLIDYSLSRAELLMDETAEPMEVTSSDLDKKQIFDAIGQDEDDALLRDTYRQWVSPLQQSSKTVLIMFIACAPSYTKATQSTRRKHLIFPEFGRNMLLGRILFGFDFSSKCC